MFRSALKAVYAAAMIATIGATASVAATYKATNVKTGGNFHTFFFGSAPFGGGNKHWQFEGGFGTFKTFEDGGNSFATLEGRIFQNAPQADATNRFDVSVKLQKVAGPGAAGAKCSGCFGGVAADWSFYEFVSAESLLTGVAGMVSGLELSLGDRPNQPIGQLGNGANDKNAGLGFSDWFEWTITKDNGVFANLDVGTKGYGDINVNLATMPLPAGGLLLLSGLFGIGVMRKMRKS
ncbi:MAG: hypothetical protein AAGA08_13600 [Pseudomonadota bacterium]